MDPKLLFIISNGLYLCYWFWSVVWLNRRQVNAFVYAYVSASESVTLAVSRRMDRWSKNIFNYGDNGFFRL